MRKNIVAGNWKMNTTVPEGVELAKAVLEKSAQVPEAVGLIIAHRHLKYRHRHLPLTPAVVRHHII